MLRYMIDASMFSTLPATIGWERDPSSGRVGVCVVNHRLGCHV